MSSFKGKLNSCQKTVTDFTRKQIKVVDFHVNSGIKQARTYWNKYTPCSMHSGQYTVGCPHCNHYPHHHGPGQFPPGPPPPGPYPGPPGQPLGPYPGPPPGSNYGFQPSAPPPAYPPYQSSSYYWIDASPGSVPPQAVQGGTDSDGHTIYVGRAFHEGDWVIAKVIPGKQATYVSYNGEEIHKHQFQVLCGTGLYWRSDSNGNVPPGAVQGGRTSSGEPLYVGRIHHGGSLTVGKIHPSHGTCYIPFAGGEHNNRNYEVLVSNS